MKSNISKSWLLGGLAAFVMYNLVFWDLIPTLIVHKHYCDTQAGVWVYKTPEQWKVENPNFESNHIPDKTYTGTDFDNVSTEPLNERINFVREFHPVSSWLPVHKESLYIEDIKKKEIIAEYANFGSGYLERNSVSQLKFWIEWIHFDSCDTGNIRSHNFFQIEEQFRNMGKGIEK